MKMVKATMGRSSSASSSLVVGVRCLLAFSLLLLSSSSSIGTNAFSLPTAPAARGISTTTTATSMRSLLPFAKHSIASPPSSFKRTNNGLPLLPPPPPRTQLSLIPSSTTAVHLAETVAPKLGLFTALLLFLAPFAAVRDTVKNNQLCDLNPLPIALMAVVSTSWLAYGICISDFYVAMSNFPGALLSLAYVIGILPVMQVAHSGTAGRSADRRELRLVQAVLLLGTTSALSLWTGLRFLGTSMDTAKTFLGLFASTFTVVMFGSPLSTVRTVVRQRNAASILGRLTMGQIINSALWTAYGVTLRQVFVWAPNAAGLVLGLMQLALKVVYPSAEVCELPDDDGDLDDNDDEIQTTPFSGDQLEQVSA